MKCHHLDEKNKKIFWRDNIMEIEWDGNMPYKSLIENKRIFSQIEDDLPENVLESLSAQTGCDIQMILNQICELNANMQNSNAKLLEVVTSSTNNVEKQKSDKKKRRMGYRLNVAEDEPLGIICKYSNGEENTEILSYDISGTVKVYNLKTGNWGKEQSFAICFPKERIVVLGEKSKVKKENLMNAFVRAGVTFETTVPRGDIAEALFNFFAMRIEHAKDVWEMPTHQGWSENMFFDANYPPFVERQEFLGMPLYEKYFSYVKPSSEAFESYFQCLTQIRSCSARAIVLMLPFYGIIQSLLVENKSLTPVITNFILSDEKNPMRICELLQVFNRCEISMNSLGVTEKELDEMIKQANDEVFLADAMYDEEDTKYYKDKLSKNALYLAKVFLRKTTCKERKKAGGRATLAVFSPRKILLGGCINIIVTEEFWTKDGGTEEVGQAVEAVMTAFVEFVKMNFLEVKRIIRKQREQNDGRKRLLAVMQEILLKFFNAEGFDMLEKAKFSPEFSFEAILVDIVNTEEMLDDFRLCVKRKISKFVIEQKGKKYGKHYVYFDSEWMYFPTHVFDRILGLEGMLPYKEEILLGLYETKFLRKDAEGFSRKLMISGKRFETYQIKREFFDTIGEVSIVDLGKVTDDEG